MKAAVLLILTLCLLSCVKEKTCFKCNVYSQQNLITPNHVVEFCNVKPDEIVELDTLGKPLPIICTVK